MNELTELLLSAVAILISLTVHEYAHAFVSARLGDPTALYSGRLTMNPLKHIDPFGALAMLLFGIGWAKPVPINPRYYKNPKRGMALTAIAGPLSNIILAVLSGLLLLISFKIYRSALLSLDEGSLALRMLYYLTAFFDIFHFMNLTFAVFNLLPISPLDGSRLLYLVLPPRPLQWLIEHERYLYFGMLAWLLLGDRFFSLLLRVDLIASTPVLRLLASLFAPTVWITAIAEMTSVLIMKFWMLLPFLP